MDYKGLQVFWPCLLPDELLSLTVLLTLQAVLGELTLGSSNVPRTVLPRDLHACHSLRLICPQHHPHSFSKHDPLSGHLALSFLCSHPSVLRSSSGSGPHFMRASSHVTFSMKEGRKVGAGKWKGAKNDIEKVHYRKIFPLPQLATDSALIFFSGQNRKGNKDNYTIHQVYEIKADQRLRNWTILSM